MCGAIFRWKINALCWSFYCQDLIKVRLRPWKFNINLTTTGTLFFIVLALMLPK